MKTVVVALSGGVDSSVAAYLLKEQGYRVVGLHMRTTQEDEEIVKSICNKLNIECKFVDYDNQMDIVKKYFIQEYKNGRTPNPCVVCNREVKFKPFIDFANSIGADYYATGHYAKTKIINGKICLCQADDEQKDQSYFLNQLTYEQISKAIFPLCSLEKTQIRKIAEEQNLITAHKKDSYDLCFVGNEEFKTFMKENYPEKSGKILDFETNKLVGTHDGLNKYTLGQRRGLCVGGQNGFSGRWFVAKKDMQNNILYVSTNEETLMSKNVISGKFNWITSMPNKNEFDCYAKVRYRQANQKVHIKIVDDHIEASFYEPQRAVTMGQYIVLYTEDKIVLGGGTIEKTY